MVFDLRKCASIVQISSSMSHMSATCLAWHPSVATQLVTASSDDLTPLLQLWDLRYATAPVSVWKKIVLKKKKFVPMWQFKKKNSKNLSAADGFLLCHRPCKCLEKKNVVLKFFFCRYPWQFEKKCLKTKIVCDHFLFSKYPSVTV